eukprot:12425909-Alexandrium_andersonii.AAC.1
MSASLVGSEMCIRDSPLSRLENTHRRDVAEGHKADGLLLGEGARVGDPVSYTHLTLPTICSV